MTGTIDYAFVHGGGQGGWVWQETIAAMRGQDDGRLGQLLALDVPGCGTKRNRATEGLDMAAVAAEMVADIEQAGLRDVVLVGHSQAGQALPVMARLRPALFRHLVYVTCSAPLPGQSVQAMIGRGVRGQNPEEVGWILDPATSTPDQRYPDMFCNDMPPAQADAFLARLGPDMWPTQTYLQTDWTYDGLADIPATFIVCRRDQALPEAWQRRFADRLGVGRLTWLDAGHQAMNSRPHALAEMLRLDIV
jgi:pimeloyl-ACP methyl ester carboxylesterase